MKRTFPNARNTSLNAFPTDPAGPIACSGSGEASE
jgi:hypothetical protein